MAGGSAASASEPFPTDTTDGEYGCAVEDELDEREDGDEDAEDLNEVADAAMAAQAGVEGERVIAAMHTLHGVFGGGHFKAMGNAQEPPQLAREIQVNNPVQTVTGDAFHYMDRPKVPMKHGYKKAYFVALSMAWFIPHPAAKKEVEQVMTIMYIVGTHALMPSHLYPQELPPQYQDQDIHPLHADWFALLFSNTSMTLLQTHGLLINLDHAFQPCHHLSHAASYTSMHFYTCTTQIKITVDVTQHTN